MGESTKLGLGILVAALALGVFGDAILRTTQLGLNAVLWVALLAVAVVILVRRQSVALVGGGRWMLLPAVLFAAAFVWRDSLTLGIVNLLALLGTLALAAVRARSGQIRVASTMEYLLAPLAAGLAAGLMVIPLLFDDIRWKEVPKRGVAGQVLAVVRGLFIAVPLVLVFGALFVAADAVFEGIVSSLFQWSFYDAVVHFFAIIVIAWFVGGLLRLMLMGLKDAKLIYDLPGSRSLGIVEMSVVLGSLNALFLAFVLVQFRYFFGGAELVQASTGLTYAEYARRGFFELVSVAALMLPLLLVADWAVRAENTQHKRLFRLLAAALVALLFVVLASAVQRMLLYQSEFGMTELRLYTSAFMGWIAVVFVWFIATVLRDKRELFAFGMLVTAVLAVAILNLINPDDMIVRTNVGRV